MNAGGKTRRVFVAVPGGREAEGGIVRMAAYQFDHWPEDSDIRLHWLATRGGMFAYMHALAAWLRHRPQLLHLNLASGGSVLRKGALALLARLRRIPYLIHLHGGGFADFYRRGSPLRKWLIRRLFGGAAHVIVLGAGWKSFVQEALSIPEDRISICPNAVPAPDAPPDASPDTPPDDGPPQLLFAGHVLARKGMAELLEALGGLKAHNWRLSIAGSGDLGTWRARAEELGIAGRVTFHGWVDGAALEGLYAKAGILVLPSYVENQPLCVLEAMGRGVSVIATHVGTLPDLIEDGRTGLLVPPQDVHALRLALQRLLEDAALRHALAEAAYAQFQQRYTLKRYVTQLETLYHGLI